MLEIIECITSKISVKRVLIMAITTFFAGILSACGINNAGASIGNGGKTTYKYDNSKVMDEVEIKKSVYSDGELVITITDPGENTVFACYDADFQYLGEDFDYEYKNGKLTIKGEGAEKISGIQYNSKSFQRVKLRYLDSNQYAILVDYFVDDLGTETYGDWDAYYTEEERAAQKAASEERKRQQDENYKAVEGFWESTAGNGEYIYIFTKEDGTKWLRQAIFYNDELIIDDTYICTINISEIGFADYYAYYQLEILDSDCFGCCYRFDLNEDMTAIMDWNTKEAGFVKREGMTPEDLEN